MPPMRLLLVNGPNLNTLGTREPDIYGTTTLAEIERMVADRAAGLGAEVRAFQANGEGAIIDWLQRSSDADGSSSTRRLTHTAWPRDAVAGSGIPAIEVHISTSGSARVPPRLAALAGATAHRRAGRRATCWPSRRSHDLKGRVMAAKRDDRAAAPPGGDLACDITSRRERRRLRERCARHRPPVRGSTTASRCVHAGVGRRRRYVELESRCCSFLDLGDRTQDALC